MVHKKIKSYSDVAGVVRRYYLDSDDAYNMARLEM